MNAGSLILKARANQGERKRVLTAEGRRLSAATAKPARSGAVPARPPVSRGAERESTEMEQAEGKRRERERERERERACPQPPFITSSSSWHCLSSTACRTVSTNAPKFFRTPTMSSGVTAAAGLTPACAIFGGSGARLMSDRRSDCTTSTWLGAKPICRGNHENHCSSSWSLFGFSGL